MSKISIFLTFKVTGKIGQLLITRKTTVSSTDQTESTVKFQINTILTKSPFYYFISRYQKYNAMNTK